MDKRKRELIDKANWDEISLTLLKYALNKLWWLNISDKSPLAGRDLKQIAEDQVMDAIGKVWDETVKWDYEKKDDLLIFLKSVVKSQVSHLCNNEEYLKTDRFPVASEESGGKPLELEELLKKAKPHEKHAEVIAPTPVPRPDEILMDKERERQDKATMDALLERLNGDKELEEVVLCIMAENTKPSKIAAQMGVETKLVNNLQKKLRRIYKDLLDQARKEKLQ